ncbi:MFS general substrate transporter [Apiospora marii]|uniref:MFS general substrate transporter n=1 Tax=Apiospora marii TaxID=335849 RepID=UPI00312E38B9
MSDELTKTTESTVKVVQYDQVSQTEAERLGLVADPDQGVDEAVDLVLGHDEAEQLDPVEARRLRNKIDKVILPLVFAIYILQYMDKNTVGSSAVLGIIEDNHLSADQFNTLGSAFYIGYLVFAYPHSWALQRFPVAKYLAANIFLWSVLLGLQCLCTSFGGLFVLRFLLGGSEGCVTNALMLVMSMFYNRTESGQRVGWTFQSNGLSQIVSGFLAFGVAHSSPSKKPAPWQLLLIIYVGLTLLISVCFLVFFPDSPAKARFLSDKEKYTAVRRIESNQSGTETKVWKPEQAKEAIRDPKTWLFFLFAAISNLQNGFGTQYGLIIQSFGFNAVQTTALNIPAGAAMIISITLSTMMLRRFPNSRCYIAALFFAPSVLAVVLLMTLPWGNRVGLLCAYYVLNFGGAPSWAMFVSWVAVTTSGHTKKLAVNAIFLVGYALGQTLCTQFWRAQYKPRNYVPYSIFLASYAGDYVILFLLRYLLNKENKRRDALLETTAHEEYGYVARVDSAGHVTHQKVAKAMLDLTDGQNLAFRDLEHIHEVEDSATALVVYESGPPPADTNITPEEQLEQQDHTQRRLGMDESRDEAGSQHGFLDIPNEATVQDQDTFMSGPPGVSFGTASYDIRRYSDWSAEERHQFHLGQEQADQAVEQANRDMAVAIRQMKVAGINVGTLKSIVIDHGDGSKTNLHNFQGEISYSLPNFSYGELPEDAVRLFNLLREKTKNAGSQVRAGVRMAIQQVRRVIEQVDRVTEGPTEDATEAVTEPSPEQQAKRIAELEAYVTKQARGIQRLKAELDSLHRDNIKHRYNIGELVHYIQYTTAGAGFPKELLERARRDGRPELVKLAMEVYGWHKQRRRARKAARRNAQASSQ